MENYPTDTPFEEFSNFSTSIDSQLTHFIFSQVPKTGSTSLAKSFKKISGTNNWIWIEDSKFRFIETSKEEVIIIKFRIWDSRNLPQQIRTSEIFPLRIFGKFLGN